MKRLVVLLFVAVFLAACSDALTPQDLGVNGPSREFTIVKIWLNDPTEGVHSVLVDPPITTVDDWEYSSFTVSEDDMYRERGNGLVRTEPEEFGSDKKVRAWVRSVGRSLGFHADLLVLVR